MRMDEVSSGRTLFEHQDNEDTKTLQPTCGNRRMDDLKKLDEKAWGHTWQGYRPTRSEERFSHSYCHG